MNNKSKIYIAGHKGMVGSAIARNLISQGFTNHVYTPFPPFDLTNQKIVGDFFKKEKPEYVFLAAARVGGIMSNNTYRAQFLYENLMIQNNIIHQSYLYNVKKLLFFGSSCIYPKNCPQPIKEEYLLTDELEYTNEPYAIAKIAGIKMCESYNIQYGTNFISVMPTNLYGPNDNYNLETSHVLPALIRKIHLGKCLENNNWAAIRKDIKKYPIEDVNEVSSETEILNKLSKFGIRKDKSDLIPATCNPKPVTITLWGTGNPYREFLYVDDVADACVFLMDTVNFVDLKSLSTTLSAPNPKVEVHNPASYPLRPASGSEIKNTQLNIGTGEDITIKKLADLVKKIIGYNGQLEWDNSKPDGTFRKLLDVSRIHRLGWKEKTDLEKGIQIVYNEYSA